MTTLVDELHRLQLGSSQEGKGKGQVLEEDAANVDGGEDGTVCAICLNSIALEDVAMLPSCDHVYCVHCIVHWASLKDDNGQCPQCKAGFSEVISYRNLDGTLQDFPIQNPVCLIRRAGWFQAIAGAHAEDGSVPEPEGSWGDDYDDCLDEDEELEEFYFSSAAGRARIVFGNRRFGEGGYVSGGRRQARATATSAPRKRYGKQGKAAALPSNSNAAFRGQTSANIPISGRRRDAGGASDGQSPPLGGSPVGCGRRAIRNARRAAVDMD